MKFRAQLILLGLLLCCLSAGGTDKNPVKPRWTDFGTVAILPFHGYRGGEMVRHVARELGGRDVEVVELRKLATDEPAPDLSIYDRKVAKLLKGYSLEGIEHIITGQLITRPLLTSFGDTKTLVVGASMVVVSTKSGKPVATSNLKRDTAYRHGGPEDIQDFDDLLPDTTERLVVQLRSVE